MQENNQLLTHHHFPKRLIYMVWFQVWFLGLGVRRQAEELRLKLLHAPQPQSGLLGKAGV